MSCPNFTGEEYTLSYSEKATVVTLYSLVSFLAIVGNGIIIFIILHFRRMWTATNYFILNLALGDTLMAIFCIPFSYWTTLILQYWPFGMVMCKVIMFLQPMTVYLSSYTLIVISVDRFVAIMFPLRPKTTQRQAIFLIAFVWLVAVGTAIPLLVVTDLVPFNRTSDEISTSRNEFSAASDEISATNDEFVELLYQCDEVWDEASRFHFSQAALVLQYLFPDRKSVV